MNTRVTTQAVHQLLNANIDAVEQLQSLLQQERKDLQKRLHANIPALLEQKQQLMTQLEQGSQLRQSWLDGAEDVTGEPKERWKMLLTDLGGPALLSRWQDFKEQLSLCQQENEVNGRMIGRGQQSVGQLLSLLKGQVESPKLYNQKGSTNNQQLSHTMVKA